MNTYEALIRQEEAMLTLLRQKVAACEQRIAALRTLAQTDDVDDAIASAVGKAVQARQAAQLPLIAAAGEPPTAPRGDGRKVRKDSVVIEVLSLLRDGEKSLDQVDEHLRSLGKERSRGYLRTALLTWRASNGWVTNPKPGSYGLTPAGKAFIDAHKGEGPGAATPRPSR
jgi:hypothetical protein